jgi:hypothetical protein
LNFTQSLDFVGFLADSLFHELCETEASNDYKNNAGDDEQRLPVLTYEFFDGLQGSSFQG